MNLFKHFETTQILKKIYSVEDRGGHLEPKTETEVRNKSNRIDLRFCGFEMVSVLKPNCNIENSLVLVLAFENCTANINKHLIKCPY